MPTDIEVLNAINNLNSEQKLTPAVRLGYNAGDDLIRIRKVISGTTFERIITDPDIADNVVNRWVDYSAWTAI